MVMMSPYANSIRPQPINATQFGLGALLERLNSAQPINRITRDIPQAVMTYDQAMSRNMQQDVKSPQEQARIDAAMARGPESTRGPDNTRFPVASMNDFSRKEADLSRPAQVIAQPANPFEGNEQYQALMDFQKSLAPNQEQQQRLQELQQAFEGTGAYKDYRINELQQQLQQRQNPMMGMGLGGARPYGMDPYRGFGRPQFPMQQPMPVPRGGYNQYQNQFGGMMGMQQQPYQQPQYQNFNMQQPYMNPYQQMRPQPQQYGGYNQYQQMGGYGNYGAMPNPYQPQQMGYNPNNYGNYAQNQFQGYGGMQAQSQGVY